MPRRSTTAPLPLRLALCATAACASLPAQEEHQDNIPPPVESAEFEARRDAHWCWQPLRDTQPPAVTDASWARDPIDDYVLAGLERAGLTPAAPAAPEHWLRRVWFDVVGLPPPPAAVAAFLADPSSAMTDGAARRRVVDELLGSPHYGERWGRHWLDLVRYAESLGHEFDFTIPNAWRYRDYVVRALNDDVPFDALVTEHIAGDLLATPRTDPRTGRNESVHGTAFWWFCEQTHSPVDAAQHQADRIDNQIDVLTKAFLGATVACARCHDHKFDAIRSADYYALYGFLKSSRYVQHPTRPAPAAALREALQSHRGLAALAPQRSGPLPAPDDALRDGDALLADFARPLGDNDRGWRRSGDAFGAAPWFGPFVDGAPGDTVRFRELAGGWANSAAHGVERSGVLHSPTFTIDKPYLFVEVAGRDARALVVVEGMHVVRNPIYGKLRKRIARSAPHWLRFDLRMWQGKQAHLQLLDQRPHDLADPDRKSGTYAADAWVAARRVVASSHGSAPTEPAAHRTRDLWTGAPATAYAAARHAAALRALPDTGFVPGLADGSGEDEAVFRRGSHKLRGEPAPRRFLEAVAGPQAMPIEAGSGRLQLARRMFAADNPLPSRVLVNRLWHHLFGRGLAPTVDNLGQLGEPPTHPDLLDRLALDLQAQGWSQKALLRRLLLSQTYAMASRGDPAAAERDPTNRLLHRQNLRRLQGEAVRDALLSFSGRLDPQLGGPPVPVHLDDDDEARGKPKSGPLDGRGRRSIYLSMRRNFLPDLLLAFDLPTPFSTVGRRNVSNVPAQSLALLNDPFVGQMCERAAQELVTAGPGSPHERLERWFLAAFGRPPAPRELDACLQFVHELQQARGVGDDDPTPWAELAHALVNKKEFVFLR